MSVTAVKTAYDRVFNFSAGPCTLPVEVLEEIRDDLMNYKGKGMSVMEMSHRSKEFMDILDETLETFRRVFNVPENYKTFFMQGGATLQNTAHAMNLLGEGVGDYVVTGYWGKKTSQQAPLVGECKVIYDGKPHNYSEVPDLTKLDYSPNASYVHWVSNETIHGVEFKSDPDLPVTSVCDMSSNIMSRPVDVSKYAMIYAGAQKNMGPAGATLVILREDLLARTPEPFHPMLSYKAISDNGSMFNTPPCFAIYVCGLVYKWVKKEGGLTAIQKRNEAKAKVLYDAIDASAGFYAGHAKADCRSNMNVTFQLPTEELLSTFVKEADAVKLNGLKGHRSLGGIRASIYNAFPLEGCQVMAEFMADFAKRNG
ncbi:MAG: phosphoserine transaminase [Fimbriimonadaceae bacterium]|nr:phosphoserine transaminase [Fimbriimonadaceae bacterium]